MRSSRRTFLITSIGVASTLALSRQAFADAPKVSETDPTAQALGYRADASQVDKAKFAKFAPGQDCGNCSFFQGKAGDAYGGCSMLPGKDVFPQGGGGGY